MFERILEIAFERVIERAFERIFGRSFERVFERIFERTFESIFERTIERTFERAFEYFSKFLKGKREECSRPKGKREGETGAKFQADPMPVTFFIGRSFARTHARTKRNDFPVGGSAGSTHPPNLRYHPMVAPCRGVIQF